MFLFFLNFCHQRYLNWSSFCHAPLLMNVFHSCFLKKKTLKNDSIIVSCTFAYYSALFLVCHVTYHVFNKQKLFTYVDDRNKSNASKWMHFISEILNINRTLNISRDKGPWIIGSFDKKYFSLILSVYIFFNFYLAFWQFLGAELHCNLVCHNVR